jgi:proline iminopeptidase
MLSLRAVIGFALIVSSISGFLACTKDDDKSSSTTQIGKPVVKVVDKEHFLSGTQFCDTYKEFTKLEQGVWVDVPRDYSHPAQGTLRIYAYTLSKFDPLKPSYIYVDGGPGQNTHGLIKEYLDGKMNELRFDQRGLGCSTPDTWELYRTTSLYSTDNTVRDMEEIRKKYGIEKWSVYGVSYGTVPATVYGSRYPKTTQSIVLEGVVDKSQYLHMFSYKAEKLNSVLATLNPAQRKAFTGLMLEGSADSQFLISYLFTKFYQDLGMRSLGDDLRILIDSSGTIRRDIFAKVREKMAKDEDTYPLPQQPGAVDLNILETIYCRDLQYRTSDEMTIDYSSSIGFYARVSSNRTNAEACDKQGVSAVGEKPYQAADYPISAPIYYFQGSHDGATLAKGADDHWNTVPKGKSYFILAQKGGHNPNLTRLESESSAVKSAEHELFTKAMMGSDITQSDVDKVNWSNDTSQKWLLFLNGATPDANSKIDQEEQGIKVFHETVAI